jgi:D-alanyl-D-alanine carboxypeptidase
VTHRFAVGSITKTLVATVVLQLVDEDVLSLDSVEKWLPGLIEAGRDITVEDLLSHRSGILDVVGTGELTWGTDLTDAKLDDLLDHPLTDPPGTTTSYSNPNFIVLGKIVEAATSHPLADELQRRVFDRPG